MDIESFQSLKLNGFNFSDDPGQSEATPPAKSATRNIASIPLPDEIPASFDYKNLPKELLKSSTVENLISQNEDLMSRLTVTLRRLAMVENENSKLSDEARRARMSQSAVSDQMLILKEKDSLWKNKLTQAEKEKEVQAEKARAFQTRIEQLANEVDRYRKYHDRIKSHVKPYIHQLKDYSRKLESDTERLTQEKSKLDAQLGDLRFQILEISKNSRLQIELREKQNQEIIQHYEDQVRTQSEELKILGEAQRELETKSIRLNKSLERQDELENQVIELIRSKDEQKNRLEDEISRLQHKSMELQRTNTRLEIQHADLQNLALDHEAKIKDLTKERQDLGEQLDSLRYMWNSKVEEIERLRSSIQSLERLNIDLSQKVNDLRALQNT